MASDQSRALRTPTLSSLRGGGEGLALLKFEPHQQGGDVGLADARNAIGLAEGGGLNGAELFAGLVGKGSDVGVVQIAWKFALALALHLVDLLLLPLEIAAVFDVDLGAFSYGKRQVAISKAMAHEIGGMLSLSR